KLKALEKEDFQNNIKVLCSGEKAWLSDIALQCTENGEIGTKSDKKHRLTFSLTLPKDFPAIVKYNKDVLKEPFQTSFP
ncbi:hypothetical protein B2I21_05625, partial [Chryseobacterium mucoviscidosis]